MMWEALQQTWKLSLRNPYSLCSCRKFFTLTFALYTVLIYSVYNVHCARVFFFFFEKKVFDGAKKELKVQGSNQKLFVQNFRQNLKTLM